MVIIGAGLSGLLAGALDRRAVILEAQPRLPNNHQAVLRFRSDKIAHALNIPFRQVRVLKDIVVNGAFVSLTPKWANAYAMKVIGKRVNRSITSLEPVTRWIAPKDFTAQLAEMCSGRISFNHYVDGAVLRDEARDPFVSTMPLPTLLDLLAFPEPRPLFNYQPIQVARYRVPGADLFQTVYFPGSDQDAYRASITGDELLVEWVGPEKFLRPPHLDEVLEAFDLRRQDVEPLSDFKQHYGKIEELDPETRKALVGRLTREYRIWSLGRFAIWKNVLLDDVLEDFWAIQRMMLLQPYDQLRHLA